MRNRGVFVSNERVSGDFMTEYERLQAGAERIVEWFRKNRKSLPWRENITPYKVWVSEIMLQQTRIEAVIPYYDRFLRELPDIASLAAAEDDRLMKLWQGLGYYTRARIRFRKLPLRKRTLRLFLRFLPRGDRRRRNRGRRKEDRRNDGRRDLILRRRKSYPRRTFRTLRKQTRKRLSLQYRIG